MSDPTRPNPASTDRSPAQLPDGLSHAALVRAAADGEGDAHVLLGPEEASAIEFERQLRRAVGRAMAGASDGSDALPPELRQRIVTMLGREMDGRSETPSPISFAENKHIARPANRTALSFFARIAAVAAVLALGSVLLYQGIQQMGGGPSATTAVEMVSNQLQFVQREHSRCSDLANNAFATKIVTSDVEEARAYAEQELGCGGKRLADAIARMQQVGYTFAGVGPCKVPGGGRSIHALFVPNQPSIGLDPVSVFLLESPGEGCKNTESGVCYACPNSTKQGKPAMLWRDHNLMVFVNAASPQGIELIRAAYEAPHSVKSL